MSKPKYYVTAPVYDPAFEPSIGSLYTAILCDAIARHKRMCGFDVAHFAGAETYQISAEYSKERSGVGRANLLGPKEREFDDLLGLVEVHGDHFCRSGSAQHVLALQTMAQRSIRHSRQAIYKGQYQGRFCPHDEIDVSDSTDPVDCAICGRAAVLISEERSFFRLSAFRDRLLALYEYRPEFIQPQFRLDQIRIRVGQGLRDISLSRSSREPGVPWPMIRTAPFAVFMRG